MVARETSLPDCKDVVPALPLGSQALRGARGWEMEVGVYPNPLPFHSTSA